MATCEMTVVNIVWSVINSSASHFIPTFMMIVLTACTTLLATCALIVFAKLISTDTATAGVTITHIFHTPHSPSATVGTINICIRTATLTLIAHVINTIGRDSARKHGEEK